MEGLITGLPSLRVRLPSDSCLKLLGFRELTVRRSSAGSIWKVLVSEAMIGEQEITSETTPISSETGQFSPLVRVR